MKALTKPEFLNGVCCPVVGVHMVHLVEGVFRRWFSCQVVFCADSNSFIEPQGKGEVAQAAVGEFVNDDGLD